MSDLTTTGGLIALGIALAESVKWLAKALLKKNGNGNGHAVHQLSEFEKLQIAELLRQQNEKQMDDIRKLMDTRVEVLRTVLRRELGKGE